LLVFYEIMKWIQITSTALFLFLFLGKTLYLRRKERLNAIIFHTGRKKGNGSLSILSVLIVNMWIACLLFYLLNSSFHNWFSILKIGAIDKIWVKIPGLLMLILAFVIFVIAQTAMGNSWRLGIDRKNPGRLVTGNIYGFSRHPIYLFFDLYFLSVFLINANLIFLVFTIAIAAILHFQASSEEDFLISIYGDRYKEYYVRVGKYFTLPGSTRIQDIVQSDTEDKESA